MSGGTGPDSQNRSLGLAAIWPWLALPFLPLLGAFGVLKVLYAPEFTFAGPGAACQVASPTGFAASFVLGAHRSFIHFEGLVVYSSVALLHVSLCLFAVCYFVMQIQGFPAPIARRTWRAVGVLVIALVVVGVIARLDATALQLTYRNTCELLCKARVAADIVPQDCQGGRPSPLLWLASIPTLAGLIAAVFAAALASATAGPLPDSSEAAWRSAFAERARILQRAFYILSTVLITSTVTIMLFLRLPSALAADEPTTLAVTSFARGMTVFWGTVFTLTLLAIFAPSAYQLLRLAQRHERASDAPSEVRAWLTQEIYVSVPKQLSNVAALLAPLLVGPLGTLLENLAAAG